MSKHADKIEYFINTKLSVQTPGDLKHDIICAVEEAEKNSKYKQWYDELKAKKMELKWNEFKLFIKRQGGEDIPVYKLIEAIIKLENNESIR